MTDEHSMDTHDVAAEGPWYACCESGHPMWTGPEHAQYEDAQADATGHDRSVHGGASTAVVLDS